MRMILWIQNDQLLRYLSREDIPGGGEGKSGFKYEHSSLMSDLVAWPSLNLNTSSGVTKTASSVALQAYLQVVYITEDANDFPYKQDMVSPAPSSAFHL